MFHSNSGTLLQLNCEYNLWIIMMMFSIIIPFPYEGKWDLEIIWLCLHNCRCCISNMSRHNAKVEYGFRSETNSWRASVPRAPSHTEISRCQGVYGFLDLCHRVNNWGSCLYSKAGRDNISPCLIIGCEWVNRLLRDPQVPKTVTVLAPAVLVHLTYQDFTLTRVVTLGILCYPYAWLHPFFGCVARKP